MNLHIQKEKEFINLTRPFIFQNTIFEDHLWPKFPKKKIEKEKKYINTTNEISAIKKCPSMYRELKSKEDHVGISWLTSQKDMIDSCQQIGGHT